MIVLAYSWKEQNVNSSSKAPKAEAAETTPTTLKKKKKRFRLIIHSYFFEMLFLLFSFSVIIDSYPQQNEYDKGLFINYKT